MNRELQIVFFHAYTFFFLLSINAHLHLQSPEEGAKSYCSWMHHTEFRLTANMLEARCWYWWNASPCAITQLARTLWKLLDVSNWTPQMINDRYGNCCGRSIHSIWIPNLAFVQNVHHRHHSPTWSVSMMSARSFSDILRMEAAMDLALIIDLAERLPFAATALACFNLLLLISCCLTSWTSKSISLARAWRGWRRRNKKRGGWWNGYWKNKGDSSASQMNKLNWSSMRQRGLVHYEGILSLTQSDSLRFRLKLPCRNVDLRVCFSVDW